MKNLTLSWLCSIVESGPFSILSSDKAGDRHGPLVGSELGNDVGAVPLVYQRPNRVLRE